MKVIYNGMYVKDVDANFFKARLNSYELTYKAEEGQDFGEISAERVVEMLGGGEMVNSFGAQDLD